VLCALRPASGCSVPEYQLGGDAPPETIEQLLFAGHFRRALAAIASVKSPDETPAARARHEYLLSKAELGLGQLDAAMESAEKALAIDPQNADYHLQAAAVAGRTAERAPLLKQLGLAKRAKRELDAAVALDPNSADALYGIVLYLWNAPSFMGGDKAKAQTYAERLTSLDAARGYVVQATLAHDRKDSTGEQAFLEKAVAANPKSYDALMAIARFESARYPERADEEDRYACEALFVDPARGEAWQLVTEMAAARECWRELDALLKVARKFVPDDLSPAYTAAVEMIKSGSNLERASDLLHLYLASPQEGETPTAGQARYELALALEKRGLRDEAVIMLELAIAEDPGLGDAKRELKRMERAP